jgi:GNAT superfamily N-acetyltransferase
MTTIRKATEQDCAAMLALVKELAEYEKALDQVSVIEEKMQEWGYGTNPLYWAFVAEQNNVIVGLALCYTRYSTWKGPRCYLEDIIVTESMRGQGIGALLFEAVHADAQEKNFTGMLWQVLDWNEPAINFYKKYDVQFDAEWVNVSIDFK